MNHLIHYTSANQSASHAAPASARTVGIPRLIQANRLLERSIAGMGCSVVMSGPTNRQALEAGTSCCRLGVPLPARALAGQALSLKGIADVVLVEQAAGCSLKQELKAAGLPVVELEESTGLHEASVSSLAGALCLDRQALRNSWLRVLAAERDKEMELAADEEKSQLPAVALLGHPYLLSDSFLNLGIKEKMRAAGFGCVLPGTLFQQAYPHGRLYGAVCLQAAGCKPGPYERTLLHRPKGGVASTGLPTLTLHLDEHFSEAELKSSLSHFLSGLRTDDPL